MGSPLGAAAGGSNGNGLTPSHAVVAARNAAASASSTTNDKAFVGYTAIELGASSSNRHLNGGTSGGAGGGVSEPANVWGLDEQSFEAAKHSAKVAYAKYLAAHGLEHLGVNSPWPETELLSRIVTPTRGAACAAIRRGISEVWLTSKICIIVSLIVSLLVIVGMGVSLGQLAALGTCAVVAKSPITVTYSQGVQVEPDQYVTLDNSFAYGSIEVVADTISYSDLTVRACLHTLSVFPLLRVLSLLCCGSHVC